MLFKCPVCSKYNKIEYLPPADDIYCSCGELLVLKNEFVFDQLEKICVEYQLEIENKNLDKIRNASDKIVAMILNHNCSKQMLRIEKQKLKIMIESICPDKLHLYELFYEPRFNRLWDQFRADPKLEE